MKALTLYGSPMSLFTGRVRSYFIKAGIPFEEEPHASPHFFDVVLPKAGGRRGIPTIEFPDGRVIRDGVAIVDHFEAKSGDSFTPPSPNQRLVCLLMDVIGAEGLLRPAMHYRWNFPEENLEFLRPHFETVFVDETGEAADARMKELREVVSPLFGASRHYLDAIETLYVELLEKLNTHFKAFPYFLGGRPSRADFAMMAPLYGHLGRDPAALRVMYAHAPRLVRWVERMNRADRDVGEFPPHAPEYLPDDEVPKTLIDVLVHLAIDFVPETEAARERINAWLGEQNDLAPGTECVRGVGMADFVVRGTAMRAMAQPFRFYLLDRLAEHLESLAEPARSSAEALLARCGMAGIGDQRLDREIGRRDNLEVWR